MGWIWQEGKTGEKGTGKGKGQNGNAGKPPAKGNAGKTSTDAPAGKGGIKKVYIYCSTPDCKGRVFMISATTGEVQSMLSLRCAFCLPSPRERR